MLSELRIADLGVIEQATIELGAGLTAVTGETGAGKTMIVTGLGLLQGQRADPGAIRRGAQRARVEGLFESPTPEVAALVSQAGGEVDEDGLIIVRQLAASRSRCFVGGVGVPAGVCADLAEHLITIHGQSEQIRLSTPERQREILDGYAGEALARLNGEYAAIWQERRLAQAELAELTAQAVERAREIDVLTFGLGEIEKVEPQPGEDEELAAEATRLQATDDLRLLAHQAVTALSGADDDQDAPNALAGLTEARKSMERVAETDDTAQALATRAAEISYLGADLATDLAAYLSDLQADPVRLEWIAARRAALQPLLRKYGGSVAEVLTWSERAAARLTELGGSDERIEQLGRQINEQDARIDALASQITAARTTAAHALAEAVKVELAALAMPHARLEFAITPLPEPGPHGADQIVLQFSANPGSNPRPLAKVASGGELSRIRLALEVVSADAERGRTLVFDEVDAGVGGRVAVEIGRRLARLAERSQVVVVTHLAQVAAFADRHFVVVKSSDGQVTTSGVRRVEEEDRSTELARMMAGIEASESARAHAAELLREAGKLPAPEKRRR